MRLPIFTETADGQLVRMEPAAPLDEDSLQDLIARFPDVIAGDAGKLLLVQREQSVPDAIDGNGRWSLDHLFVTRDARPVLVEVKRASDTRLRREVVGQLLDYAANGVAYWKPGDLMRAFDATCEKAGTTAEIELQGFLKEEDPAEFWDQVDANLAAGRIRLVIVADVIPKELARIIEFLNEQMRASVLAVELNYYQSEDGRRTLAPRIIGDTERADAVKSGGRTKLPPISIEDWLETFITPLGDDAVQGAGAYLDLIAQLGGETEVASTQGSIVAKFFGEDGSKTYPFFLQRNGTISIGFGWVNTKPGLQDETVRLSFLKQFDELAGGLSTQNPNGHPAFPAARLLDPQTRTSFESVATEFISAAMSDIK